MQCSKYFYSFSLEHLTNEVTMDKKEQRQATIVWQVVYNCDMIFLYFAYLDGIDEKDYAKVK